MSDINGCFSDVQMYYQGIKRKTGMSLLDLPPSQRPRERLLCKGPQSLSDAELLAIILNTGIKGKNVVDLAEDLLRLLDHNKEIPNVRDIARLSGIGYSKACSIAAMLEFGRRRYGSSGTAIKKPSDIFFLVRHNADRKQERFISLSLNGAHEVLSVRVVTIGLVNRTIVHPREVFLRKSRPIRRRLRNYPEAKKGIGYSWSQLSGSFNFFGDLLYKFQQGRAD
jgi:DNA repair protein RadC